MTIAPFDLLLRNAHVIDPARDWDGLADVGVRDGRIAAFGRDLDSTGCTDIRDAIGSYVSPGWIDLHGHWYEGGLYGINAEIGLNHGVTTAVDAGTAGFANFPAFHDTAIVNSLANILAFVHVSCLGLHTPFAEELLELRYARPEETAIVIDRYRDSTVGVKVRIGAMTAGHGNQALDLAIEAARMARTPAMVHISAGADEPYILSRLRPGDILTHCFHGNSNGMFAADRGLIAGAWSARERGVVFDVGHGCGSFSWESAQRAFEYHFWPDTISTDLHRYSVDAPWSVTMPQVLSKFLSLGMSLRDVIAKVTAAPARVLRREHQIGSFHLGAAADLVQFRIEEGEFVLTDAQLRSRLTDRMIQPLLCVRNGKVYRPGDITLRLRPLYPCDRPLFDSMKALSSG